MKKTLVAISLALNVLLLTGWIVTLTTDRRNWDSARPGQGAPGVSAAPSISARTPVATLPSAPAAFTERSLQQWLAQLRAAGAPDQLLARVLVADSESRWEEIQRALQAQIERGELDAEALIGAREQHELDRDNALQAVLGSQGFHRWDREQVLREANVARLDLSEREKEAWYQLQKDAAEQQRELERSRRNGDIDDADFIRLQEEVTDRIQEQLRSLLGESRYAALTGASDSGMAADLRRKLKPFNATEEQVASMLDAQRQWAQQISELDENAPDYDDRRQAIETARDEACRRVLGAETFTRFQKEQDEHYRTLKRFANAWQLSEADIEHVYSTIQSYQKNVRDYQLRARAMERKGEPVDWSQVEAALQKFSQQTRKACEAYLGPERFSKMDRNELLFALD